MTIPVANQASPLRQLLDLPIVFPGSGLPTPYFVQLLHQWREYLNAANRVIPCVAAGTNTITLTPNAAAPLIEKYVDYEIFPFVAENTSSGDVSATVVPAKGVLATLNVYKDNGANRASTNDVVAGSLYLAVFVDALNAGAGGFVLK